jgi:hypothetical protein
LVKEIQSITALRRHVDQSQEGLQALISAGDWVSEKLMNISPDLALNRFVPVHTGKQRAVGRARFGV